jgi:Zn-dependent alcohol dehydrogenase
MDTGVERLEVDHHSVRHREQQVPDLARCRSVGVHEGRQVTELGVVLDGGEQVADEVRLLVSLPKDGTLKIPVFDTVLKGISVIGSIVGTRQDLAEVFALHAAGRTRAVAEERTLETINESFEDVLAGRTPARLVIRM